MNEKTKYWWVFLLSQIPAIVMLVLTFLNIITDTHPYIFTIVLFILGVVSGILFDILLKNRYRLITEIHFPRSYPIVKKNIIPAYHNKSMTTDNAQITQNNDIDKLLKSPIEYSKEMLSCNLPPVFNPNSSYLNEIYDDKILHIVAITAENPNLWLDPALSFYLVNCCATTLIRKINGTRINKLFLEHFETANVKNQYEENTIEYLQQLIDGKIESFELSRFILFNDDQYNYLKDSVFPSLKATQDLFGMKSYFIKKENLKSNKSDKEQKSYNDSINYIWQTIYELKSEVGDFVNQENFVKIVEKRKMNNLPEFLIFFYKNGKIVIHTYILSIDERIEFGTNNPKYNEIKGHINIILNYLAEYYIEHNSDWTANPDRTLNMKNSFINWE